MKQRKPYDLSTVYTASFRGLSTLVLRPVVCRFLDTHALTFAQPFRKVFSKTIAKQRPLDGSLHAGERDGRSGADALELRVRV